MTWITRREFVPRRCRRIHGELRRAALPQRARAGAGHRKPAILVMLYLSGGNDSLSTLMPVHRRQLLQPPAHDRRPRRSGAADRHATGAVSRSGCTRGCTGLRDDLRLRAGSRCSADRLSELEPLALSRHRHLVHGRSRSPQGTGWLGRYLDTLPSPVDPLVGWTPRARCRARCWSRIVGVPAIPSVAGLRVSEPQPAARKRSSRVRAATRISSHLPVDRPHLSFVNATAQAAFATLDRVAPVGRTVERDLSEQRISRRRSRRSPGRWSGGIGTKVFWVQTGGYDTHAAQNPNQANGSYSNLMSTLNDAVLAFYNDLQNQGLLGDTLCCSSRSSAAASPRTAARAPTTARQRDDGDWRRRERRHLRHGPEPAIPPPTIRRSRTAATTCRYETDFRSVYARVIDRWLGADSAAILGADFRGGAPAFL